MKVQIGNLVVTVDSLDELDQLVQRYGSLPPSAVPGAATAAVPGAAASSAPAAAPPPAPALPAELPPGPLEKRCEELREQHGLVYIIAPREPVAPGQKVRYGREQHMVEVLEPADLADRKGKIVPGRWYAKFIDQVPDGNA